SVALQPRRVFSHYRLWRCVMHYSSGFTMLTALWAGVVVATTTAFPAFLGFMSPLFVFLFLTSAIRIFFLWCIAVHAMIIRRSARGVGRWLACILVPLIGLAFIALGIYAIK